MIDLKDIGEMSYASQYDGYEGSFYSSPVYEDHIQTVPDIETFPAQPFQHQAQEVPTQGIEVSFDDETTPVKINQLHERTNRITPLTLNFDMEQKLTWFAEERQRCTQKSIAKKKKKTKRRSYLSNDLPEEIRNQRRTVANARERARVGRMASGYEALQKSLPKYLSKPKMRKVDILNSALNHIHNLMNMLSSTALDLNQNNITNTTTMPCHRTYTYDATRQEMYSQNQHCINYLTEMGECTVEDILSLDEYM